MPWPLPLAAPPSGAGHAGGLTRSGVSTLWDRPTDEGGRWHTPTFQGLQPAIVAHKSCPDRGVTHIGDSKFVTRLPDNRADGRIMDVTNGREQIMLNLEVQPSQIPAGKRIRRGKIRCRFHLMHRPCVYHLPVWASGMRNAVCSTVCAS